ncbi:MAG TPA: MFS transporter [Gemmataceae bacterium]|jgi:MFS family permease|nr:MFS transporter [Gemmataceae bacterium]
MNSRFSTTSISTRYKWLVVGMLWWISFFNYADRQAIFSVFSLLRYEMCLSKVELGLLGSSFAWVYGLGAPFAGMVIDRVRRKSAILGGLHVWSAICVATAFSRSFPQLLFFRAAEGLGETFYYPASMSMLSDYHGPRTRSRALGLHQTSVYMGTIAGGFFAGLIAEHFGWRWSFIVFGMSGIVLGLLLDRFLLEPQRGAADKIDSSPLTTNHSPPTNLGFWQAWPIIWRTPTVLILMVAFMCANFVAMVLLSWMPDFLAERFHLSLSMAGLTATIFAQLASMVGSPLGGWLADIWRRRTPGGRMFVQALAVLAGAPFVVLCGQTQSVGWLILALTAWGFFKGLYDANIFASAFDVIPAEIRGTTAGLMNMLGWLGGGASAPLVIGILAEKYGLGLAISSAAVVYVASGLLLLIAGVCFVSRDVNRLSSVERK